MKIVIKLSPMLFQTCNLKMFNRTVFCCDLYLGITQKINNAQ